MGHETFRVRDSSLLLLVAGVLILISAPGCATVTGVWERLVFETRRPGEDRIRTTEETVVAYQKASAKRPLFVLERSEVIPTTVSPGGKIAHRFIYAFLPEIPSQTLRGRVRREIFFRGSSVLQDDTDMEFKPGTWHVDVRIPIPGRAEEGIYALVTTVSLGQGVYREEAEFRIKR